MPIIEGHHDFGVLEQRLEALIREAQAGHSAGPLAPIAIIAPTRRLLSYLQVRLAGAFGGLLNVHFFHHHSLAREAAASAGFIPPRMLSDRVEEALVRHLVRSGGGPLAAYVADRPGSAAALRRTLNDLREAGVEPGAAQTLKRWNRKAGPALRLYAEYARHLDRLSGEGLADRSGFLRATVSQVRDFGSRYALIVHYGAYELIGANLDLMRALEDSGARLVYLVPYHPRSPAYAYAGRFWTEMLGTTPEPIPDGPGAGRLLGHGLPALYDETATGPPSARGPVTAFHTQGAEAELREAALRILALHRDHGTALRDIAVIARSLEPYAAALRPVFEEHGLPFVTDATLGAPREAPVQAALQLARTVLEGFERQPLMDLLRGGLLRIEGHDPSSEALAWDRLSRRWQASGGHATWTRDLPSWVEEWMPHVPDDAADGERARALELKARRLRQARALSATVDALARAMEPVTRATGWSAWAGALQVACRSLLSGFGAGSPRHVPPADPAAAAVFEVLADMRDLDAAGVPFSAEDALAFFESGLQETAIRVEPSRDPTAPPGSDNGGVRVLDAMQARGLSFDAVFLIGLNADLFPRRAREDPFFGDADRLALRERLRLPVPVGSRAAEEERLLFAHLLGCARTRLTLSWQRADARGRAKVASLALREVARLTRGHAGMKALVDEARRITSHPGKGAAEARDDHGLLSTSRARLGAALQLGSPARLLPVVDRLPGASASETAILQAGLPMLQCIEGFAPGDLRYDACVGDAAPAVEVWSPSRLERLGTCPQRYFFEHVLGIEELEEALEAYELEPADMGRRVHAVLRDLYADLRAAGVAGEAAARIGGRLPAAWRRHTGDLARRLGADYPVFWAATEDRWLLALRRFLEHDLSLLARSRSRLLAVEEEARSRLPLGKRREIDLRGRFDRVARRADGVIVISDYKTSGDLEARVRLANALKGLHVQLPLYVLLAENAAPAWGAEGAPVEAEILGIGPDFAPPSGSAPPAGHEDEFSGRVSLDAQGFRDRRAAFLETLEVLVDLAASGSFPLHAGRWCNYCPFTRACRRQHTPTLGRLGTAAQLRDYATLARKSTRKPFLADAAGGADEEGEP